MQTSRPGAVALVLLLGVLAVAYNVRAYSKLFGAPKPPLMSTTTSPERERTDDAGRGDTDRAFVPISRDVLRATLASLPETGRDPFRFTVAVAPGPARSGGLPVLQGVLVGDSRRVAWINGRAHSEGEEVDGHLLLRIERDRVVVVREGREYELLPAR